MSVSSEGRDEEEEKKIPEIKIGENTTTQKGQGDFGFSFVTVSPT